MQEIKKIGVFAIAKIAGIFGLIIGLFYSFLSKIVVSIAPEVAVSYGIGALPWASVVLMVVWVAVVYFLGGLVGAVLYNVFAKAIGGITIELAEKKQRKK